MMSTEQKLVKLAKKLKPTVSEMQQYNAAINAVQSSLAHDQTIKMAEIWVCGSLPKGTAVGKRSDVDAVVLLSPKQNMKDIKKKFQRSLKTPSTTPPKILRKAVYITVRNIPMDVLPTKFGQQGPLGQAQSSRKDVATIAGYGTIFKGLVRILKYWRDFPSNAPSKEYIPSFGLEIIMAYLFRNYDIESYLGGLRVFFDYVGKSKLKKSLGLHDRNGNTLLTYNFNFRKKQHFLDQAKHAYRLINKNPPNLSFIGL